MDFQLLFNNMNIITTFIVLLSIFISLKQWKRSSKANHVQEKLPPGPPTLPIIGHLHLLGGLPLRSFKTLAQTYGDIMYLKLGEVSTIVVSSPAIAREVLKTRDPLFAERPEGIATNLVWYNGADIAFSPYGEYWRQMRKICIVELLSAKSVRSFSSIRNDEVSKLIESIKSLNGSPTNLSDAISQMLSSITCRAAFGKVCRDNGLLIDNLKQALLLAGGFLVADLFPSSKLLNILSWNRVRLLMMHRKIDVILDDIIKGHIVNMQKIKGKADNNNLLGVDASSRKGNGEFGNEDLVDALLRVQETEELQFPIANDNIKAIIYDMFTAGSESTSATIDWAMSELMRNPRVRAKVQDEVRQTFKDGNITGENDVQQLKYLKLVIKETLRLHPAVPLVPRSAREECEINGYKIPKDARVLVNNWGIVRDTRYWKNPESFEPERFENSSIDFTGAHFEFLPFGSGRRMCPGMTFALANAELPLARLLYHFDWELANGIKPDQLDMTENPGLTSSRKQNLHVVATPYHPA